MGMPRINPVRWILMGLLLIVGPWIIHRLSDGNLWLLVLCLSLVLLGRYAAPEILRRAYSTVLIALALGTFSHSVIGPRVQKWAPVGWRETAEPMTIAVSYVTGFGLTWLGLWVIVSGGGVFALGLDEFLRERPGAVRRFLIWQFLGLGQAYQIVEDGEVKLTKPPGVFSRLGGRGLLIVKPANAVITEWGGSINRVVGPGISWTKMFENVKQVIDLNPQRIERGLSLQTQEGVPLTADVLATYQIRRASPPASDTVESKTEMEKKGKMREGDDATAADRDEEEARTLACALGLPQPEAYPIDKEAVLRAAYCSAHRDWKQCTEDAITIAVVETINCRSLDELYLLNQREGPTAPILTMLSAEALQKASGRACPWGVSVTELNILNLEPPPEVRERVLRPIVAAAEAEVIGTRGEAQAALAKILESMRSEIRTAEIGRMIELLQDYQDKIPGEQILRVITIAERLVGALAQQAPEDSLRLIQAAEEAIAQLTAK